MWLLENQQGFRHLFEIQHYESVSFILLIPVAKERVIQRLCLVQSLTCGASFKKNRITDGATETDPEAQFGFFLFQTSKQIKILVYKTKNLKDIQDMLNLKHLLKM